MATKKLGAFLYPIDQNTKVPLNELTIAYQTSVLGSNKPFIWIDDADAFPVDGQGDPLYQDICSVSNPTIENGEYGGTYTTDYKQNRDYIKDIVAQVGWDNLSAASQTAAAMMNIGTGAQILAAIPDDATRDESSYQYLKAVKGYATGVRGERALRTEAIVWSRMKHLDVTVPPSNTVMPAPEFIIGLIDISTPAAGEMGGVLLDLYVSLGIQGYILGDKVLGLGDFIQETPGSRYDPANGGGLRTHALLAGLVPSGFADMNEFANEVYNIWQNGNY